jgi:hypothetical protein
MPRRYENICEGCGQTFKACYPDTACCCNNCAVKAYQRRIGIDPKASERQKRLAMQRAFEKHGLLTKSE